MPLLKAINAIGVQPQDSPELRLRKISIAIVSINYFLAVPHFGLSLISTSDENQNIYLWLNNKGDTVNIAARLEESGEAGKAIATQSAYALIRNHFTCEFWGEIEAKHKSLFKMYFVKEAN